MILVHGLYKKFGEKAALNGIDLKVTSGERVAFVGHNGSGKTTLLRCILALHAFEGQIAVAGLDIRAARRRVLTQIGFVPQNPPALRFSVAEYLAFAEQVTGVLPAQVAAVAARLGLDLEECRGRAFRKLSGGMKQKLLIAAAMARRPALLIMDEPTANLDPKARAAFFELLAELPADSAVLLSSHRVDELSGLVTRLVELDGGRIVRDDALTAAVGAQLAGKMRCRVVLSEALASVVRGLEAWGLRAESDKRWSGVIGSPDRFRLLADLTRWSAVVASLSLEPDGDHNVELEISKLKTPEIGIFGSRGLQ